MRREIYQGHFYQYQESGTFLNRRHYRDVYLEMSLIQNGSSYVIYYFEFAKKFIRDISISIRNPTYILRIYQEYRSVVRREIYQGHFYQYQESGTFLNRRHYRDVYLEMSLIQNGSSYVIYYFEFAEKFIRDISISIRNQGHF